MLHAAAEKFEIFSRLPCGGGFGIIRGMEENRGNGTEPEKIEASEYAGGNLVLPRACAPERAREVNNLILQ